MPHVFTCSVRRGAVRLSRTWEADANERFAPAHSGGGGSNAGRSGPSTVGRRGVGVHAAGCRELRWDFVVVHGRRLGHGQRCSRLRIPRSGGACPDARTLVRHREAFKMAWHRKWGPPIGSWHVEFQPRKRRPEHQRHAPHLHMYLGLPSESTRTSLRHCNGARLDGTGWRNASASTRGVPWLEAPEGEFADWMLATWWRIVGSGQTTHRTRGADIPPAFWSDDVEAVSLTGLQSQTTSGGSRASSARKRRPETSAAFGSGAYGVNGMASLRSRAQAVSTENPAFFKERRIYRRLVEEQLRAEAAKFGQTTRGYRGPRGPGRADSVPKKDAPHVAGLVAGARPGA